MTWESKARKMRRAAVAAMVLGFLLPVAWGRGEQRQAAPRQAPAPRYQAPAQSRQQFRQHRSIGRRRRHSIGKCLKGRVGRSDSRMVIRGRARGLRIRVADMGTRVMAGGSGQRTTMAQRLRRGTWKTG